MVKTIFHLVAISYIIMKTHSLNLPSIYRFWDWFSSNCTKFGQDFTNELLLDELNNRISELGEFVWEIGPGNKSLNQLVISPGGDIEKLPLTKEIIKYAKVLSDWEFYYAKPIKNWNFEFNFEQLDGNILYINAFRWNIHY